MHKAFLIVSILFFNINLKAASNLEAAFFYSDSLKLTTKKEIRIKKITAISLAILVGPFGFVFHWLVYLQVYLEYC